MLRRMDHATSVLTILQQFLRTQNCCSIEYRDKLPQRMHPDFPATLGRRRWRQRFYSTLFLLLLLCVAGRFSHLMTFELPTLPRRTVLGNSSPRQNSVSTPSTGRVALEAFVMSKCPDARDCLHDLVVPAMEEVSSLVDFRVSFIGE